MPRFLLALILVALICSLIGYLPLPQSDRYAYPLHSWTWWTVKNVRDRMAGNKQKPNVALLGSSLMVVAMAETDATWSKQRIDLTTYRDARYFDYLMNQRCSSGQKKFHTINLSSPGQIPSDAYLTLKMVLAEGARPSRVIYGMAPRDVFDSTLSSPFETEAYRYLSRLVPTSELDAVLQENSWSGLNRRATKVIPLLNRSIDLQMFTTVSISKQLEPVLHQSPNLSLAERMQLLNGFAPLAMEPGFIHAEVADSRKVEQQYSDNLADYVARYRNPSAQFYQGQIASLGLLIRLCKAQDLKLTLVNMPIQKCNSDLLDRSSLSRYKSDLRKISEQQKVRYVDLCNFDRYSKRNYRDSVHLNGFGGRTFVNELTSSFNSSATQEPNCPE